ncbi:MAG TPA: type II toxin-antitoxin system prevent-host-death family antitoxin [Aestuariivirga sp.]|nr:type II toxin-antitoxin system prevent-host-death family antitoxin [Aestuariivirga sp.]
MNKHTRVWSLQEAKAKFSEVVRRAQTEGPQTVTVHGKNAVTITTASVQRKRRRKLTGADLVKALQSCPVQDFEIPERPRTSRFRDVEL